MVLVPSVEAKVRLPPAQVLELVAGQFMLRVPAGLETVEPLMEIPEPPDEEPPELVKLPRSAYARPIVSNRPRRNDLSMGAVLICAERTRLDWSRRTPTLTLRPFKLGAMLHRDPRKINQVVTFMCNLPHVIFGSPRSGVRLWNTLGCRLGAGASISNALPMPSDSRASRRGPFERSGEPLLIVASRFRVASAPHSSPL